MNPRTIPGTGDYERFPNTGDPRDPRNDSGPCDAEADAVWRYFDNGMGAKCEGCEYHVCEGVRGDDDPTHVCKLLMDGYPALSECPAYDKIMRDEFNSLRDEYEASRYDY